MPHYEPDDFTCSLPTCMVLPQVPCRNPDGTPFLGDDGKPAFHTQRIEAAGAQNANRGSAPSSEAFRAAALADDSIF